MADCHIRYSEAHEFERIFEIWMEGQKISTDLTIVEEKIPALRQKLLRLFNDEDSTFLVAHIDSRILGWHAFYPVFRNPLISGTAVQTSTYVDPQCSSAGVGSKLLQHGLLEVKRKGIKQIYHWVNTNNLLANKAAAKFNHTRVKIPGVAVPEGLPDFNLYIIPTDSLELDSKDRPL